MASVQQRLHFRFTTTLSMTLFPGLTAYTPTQGKSNYRLYSVQVSHCQRWQTVMAVLSLTLATLMCVTGVRQFLHPWDLRHHAFFHGEPPSCALHALAMLGPTITVTKVLLQKLPEQ